MKKIKNFRIELLNIPIHKFYAIFRNNTLRKKERFSKFTEEKQTVLPTLLIIRTLKNKPTKAYVCKKKH